MDANNDGAVTRGEFEAMHARQQRPRGEGKARRGGGMHGMGMIGGRMFDMADANNDGRVSLQEAQSTALRHFDMADANRDGQVSRDERRQTRQRMLNERRPG